MRHLELINAMRDEYYTLDLPHLLQHASYDYVIGGDFNCVVKKSDCTGTPTTSRPLTTLVHRCKLIDAWNSTANNTGYTHYTNTSASRIDRIYMSPTVNELKIQTTTLAAAFTDHNAVQVTLSGKHSYNHRGRGYWKLNATLLTMDGLKEQFRQQWLQWKRKQTWYDNIGRWWSVCAKRRIKQFFKTIGKERAYDKKQQTEFYYSCIYELLNKPNALLNKPTDFPDVHIKLKYYKAKIIQAYRTQFYNIEAETRERSIQEYEQLSLNHIVDRHKRQKKKY